MSCICLASLRVRFPTPSVWAMNVMCVYVCASRMRAHVHGRSRMCKGLERDSQSRRVANLLASDVAMASPPLAHVAAGAIRRPNATTFFHDATRANVARRVRVADFPTWVPLWQWGTRVPGSGGGWFLPGRTRLLMPAGTITNID